MSTIRFCTFTGAGDATSLPAMRDLSHEFPFIEWAVLYSPQHAGLQARYPGFGWLERFAEFAQENTLLSALHLCGPAVADFLEHPESPVRELAKRFGRVQLNMRLGRKDIGAQLAALPVPVILQIRDHDETSSANLRALLRAGCLQNVLYDNSGGRGVLPATWPTREALDLPPGALLGYAGGIGPENVTEVLHILRAKNPGQRFSIDMESRLFGEDGLFSLAACRAVAEKVHRSEIARDSTPA